VRSWLVAVTIRTSTRSERVPPSRSNSPSCRTRRIFGWVTGERSATSSRNSVPPSASSKRPSLRPAAPVNAPFSWPNSSDSSSVSGRAAQLTAMNGPLRRLERSWMARATSSLPVPLSPWTSTVAELSATCCTSIINRRKAGLVPIMLPCRSRSSRRFCRARFWAMRSRRSRACRTTLVSWASWNGLVRKSVAPSFIARTASSTVPKAVSRITSTSGATALASRSSSRPVSPGILRSESTRSTPPACSRSSAARPSGASTTAYPSRVSARSRLWRTAGSSSATRRVASGTVGSGMLELPDRQGHREGGPRPGSAAPADLAAVLLDDLARDGEAEPGPLRLGGEELLEEAPAHLRRDPGSAVGHRDLHRLVHAGGGEGEGAALRHRLDPVLQQVQDRLAQQGAVELHRRHRGVGGHLHHDALTGGERAHELRHRGDHVVDRVLLELRPREARKGEVLLGERVEGG